MQLFRIAALSLAVLNLPPLHAASITIDFDTAATGFNLDFAPLVTALGTISAVNLEINDTGADAEFIAAGASGNTGDHLGMPGPIPLLTFDFDVDSISLVYGGNEGDITIQVRDAFNNIVDSFFQVSTSDFQPAGPIVLSGTGIRSLEWFETDGMFAPVDNLLITSTVVPIPEPSTIMLFAAGLALVGLRRRGA